MKKDATSIVDHNTRSHIRSLKKHVTILFTDIVDSTQYWDKFGDVQGRLMVNRHNRLLFPIVTRFKGRIIKTIGDSIMAAFTKPEHAMKAAVAMQQTMAIERQGDDTFKISIRIGIHTGDAIVEKEDVYGDIVNVAARVESVGKADEILVSQATTAYIDDEFAFIFKRKGWFVPKGKNKKLYVYTCDWHNHPLLIAKNGNTTALPVSRRQKIELTLYIITILGGLYFIYLNYLRYLVSDTEKFALLYLNINNIVENFPVIVGVVTLIIGIQFIILVRVRMIPLTMMRLIKGGFIFTISFILVYLIAHYLPVNLQSKWDEKIRSSEHQYVEVLENNSFIFEEPSLNGQALLRMPSGRMLLQTDYMDSGDLAWHKVLLSAGKSGWIVQISPPQMGVPEKIVSRACQFHFRYKDLYVFILAFLCFIFGFWKFRIRPL